MDVGVIGTGNMGRNHARVYSELRGVGEVFIFDTDAKRSADVAKQFQCQSCRDLPELLKKVDAVSVCVPTSLHFELASQAIAKGVNVLVEKPLASDVASAEKLVKMSQREGLVSGVGHIERFNPVVKEVKNLMKNPIYLEVKRHNPGSGRITDVGVVQDLMVHDIDIIWNSLFRDSQKRILSAAGVKRRMLDLASVSARFGPTLANISASRVASKKVRSIIVEDEFGTIEADMITQEVFVYRNPEQYAASNSSYKQENVVDKVSISKVEPLRVELKTFLDCVKAKRQFEVSFADGLTVMKVANEITAKVDA